jgi:tetratricopeptide (TPR) repeat protein
LPEPVAVLREVIKDSARSSASRCEALSRLGDLSNRLGLHDQAIGYCREGLQLGDDHPMYRYNFANILQQAGPTDEAISEYDRLLAGDLHARMRAMIRVNRGAASLFLNRLTEAAADCTAVIEDPDAPADQKVKALVQLSALDADERLSDEMKLKLAEMKTILSGPA